MIECSIAEKVHDTMHTVFWDVLREDLAADPPKYEHVIKLIGEAKEVRICTKEKHWN